MYPVHPKRWIFLSEKKGYPKRWIISNVIKNKWRHGESRKEKKLSYFVESTRKD